MELPSGRFNLPVNHLAAVFGDRTTSYKFFWFLALLKRISLTGSTTHKVEDLAIQMIVGAWHPHNRFRLSFGAQDRLGKTIGKLCGVPGFVEATDEREIWNILHLHKESALVRNAMKAITRYVPYLFLSPWFSSELRGLPDNQKNNLIIAHSNKLFNTPFSALYRFTSPGQIEMGAEWFFYIKAHLHILEGFAYWHLTKYLERNNPGVPNIPEKLIASHQRDLKVAHTFWRRVITVNRTIPCIYSGAPLSDADISIDHFIPWTFVVHDQLWNLVPTFKNVNSSKGDRLPSAIYLKEFAIAHYNALQTHKNQGNVPRDFIDDYVTLFRTTASEIYQMPPDAFEAVVASHMKPMLQIAANSGFQADWLYRSV